MLSSPVGKSYPDKNIVNRFYNDEETFLVWQYKRTSCKYYNWLWLISLNDSIFSNLSATDSRSSLITVELSLRLWFMSETTDIKR
jgi:hypothetical protein